MDISKTIYKELEKIIKQKVFNNKYELEARLCGINTNKKLTNINLNQLTYEYILKYLIYPKDKNGLGLNVKKKTYLDILIKNSDIRITIDNNDEIKKYWLTSELNDIDYSIMKKNNIYNYTLDNYSLKFSLSNENIISKEKFKMNNNINSKEKIFRYKNRYEILTNDNLFRIDLTELRQVEAVNLKNSNIFNLPIIYEIELEYIGNIKNPEKIIKGLLTNLNILLSLFQKSFYLITNNEYETLITFYSNLVKTKYFVAANPITLQFNNLENKSNSIINKYSVTYKADGERNFLVILSSIDKKIDGNIYLLNNNFIAKKLGINCKKWAGSLLEVEYIEDNNKILLYDILFYKNKDIRNLNLLDGKDNRFNYIELFLKDVESNDKFSFEGKKYYYESKSIFDDCKELLNKKQDYPIDGLIFTPINKPYPKNKCDNIYKWKPPLYNSIDFLIEIDKEDGVERKIPINYKRKTDAVSQIYQCKVIKLKVSGFREKLNKNNNRDKICMPVDFKYENICYIPITDDNIYAFDKENNKKVAIKDNQIVEFIYDKQESIKEFRWKPIRIRYDKTLKYRNGENMFGNFETVANNIWFSIQNPITEEILSTGQFTAPSSINNKEYYDAKSYNNDKNKRLSYQKFHSGYVKYNLLKETISMMKDKEDIRLFDIGYGKLGDMNNWKRNNIKFIFGVDNNEHNFDLAVNIYEETPLPKPELILTFGDFGKLIYPDFNITNDKISIELMEKYLTAKNTFDIVSSQFSLSYFWESEVILKTLLQNVSDCLKIGGYFIGTCFNSKRVIDMLEGKKEVKRQIDDKVIWSIKKLYRSFKFDSSKGNFNKKIEIYIDSFGKTIEENLVNMDYFIKLCSSYKLELIKNEDFKTLFEHMSKNKNYKNIYSHFTDAEKEFSFLNDIFIFKKIEPAPTILLTKLLKKINK